jgi:predicted regulator of Ras-like GTPase activity (Roadblock/LC7/MglB family)
VSAPTDRGLDWLLSDFAANTPRVRYVLVVSSDGLRLAVSDRVDPYLADQICAAISGLVSLARGTASLLEAEPANQTIVEMANGYLFATSISLEATLAVVTDRTADMGLVGYEMTMLAARVGHALTPGAHGGRSRDAMAW